MSASHLSSFSSDAVVAAGLTAGRRRGLQKGTGQIQGDHEEPQQKGTGPFSGETSEASKQGTGQFSRQERLSVCPGVGASTSWRLKLSLYGWPALIAVAAHAALALSGEKQPQRAVQVAAVPDTSFTVELKSEPEDDEVVMEDTGSGAAEALSPAATFAPPRLVDVPSFSFSDVFVQPAQPVSVPLQTPGFYQIPAAPSASSGTGTGLGQIFSLAAVEREPELVARVSPFFPKDLQRAGVQGEVLLRFVVTRSGEVRDAEVVSSSHPGFEQAALQAVRKWRFKPGSVQGRPVATRMEQPIGFTLSR